MQQHTQADDQYLGKWQCDILMNYNIIIIYCFFLFDLVSNHLCNIQFVYTELYFRT